MFGANKMSLLCWKAVTIILHYVRMIFYIGKHGTSFLVMKKYVYKICSDTAGEDCISKKNWSHHFKISLLSEETIIHPQTWQFFRYYYRVIPDSFASLLYLIKTMST